MKNKILAFIIICFISFKMHSGTHFSKTKYSSPIFDSAEVILGLTEFTEINYTKISAAIKAMPGVNYTAYCGNHSVFLFYIDKTIYATKELFYNDFTKQFDCQNITSLKDGTIKDILSYCSFVNSTDAGAYKLTQ
jgi:hypothetical protein